MKYEKIIKGNFIARPNRFIAEVRINGKTERVHVKNTGRCRELLLPEAEVYLQDHGEVHENRKTRFSLCAVKKGSLMINMDSQAPNKVVEEGLSDGTIRLSGLVRLARIQREKTYGSSRFDFYLEDEDGKQAWLEVKGVTLEEGRVARFPDAPTERGIKHIHELCKAAEEGYFAYILFVVQMEGIRLFRPNDDAQKAFGEALREAEKKGVSVLAYDCKVTENTLKINQLIPVKL